MNLEESDSFALENEKNEKRKKVVFFSIIMCLILAVLFVLMIISIRYQDSLTLKMYVDGTKYDFSSKFFQEIDGNKYVNLRELSNLFKYSYQNGEYKKYNEKSDSCYISNGIETVAISANDDFFTKYITSNEEITLGTTEISVKNQIGYSETFSTNVPIKFINEEIYVPFENITDIFNTYVDTSTENRIKMYTLENLFTTIVANVASLGGKYTNVSGDYENIRALAYGYAVVGKGDAYGVISSFSGQEIIGPKYSRMQFIQNSQEFLVNAENTVGLISNKGDTIIEPTEYDEISLLDEKIGIYMVRKGSKYGVLNRKGQIVIYVEYDRIGLKDVSAYPADQIKNGTILFGKSIPVYKDGKYGLISTDGKEELPTEYRDFGCKISDKSEASRESILLIPEEVGIKGVIVSSDKGYGVYDVNSDKWIISDVCSNIYSKTKLGETTYYMEYNDVEIDMKAYIEENNLTSVKKNIDTEINQPKTTTEETISAENNKVTEEVVEELSENNVEEVVVVETPENGEQI